MSRARRLLLVLGIAFAALPAPAALATVTVHIMGAGAVTGTGINCSRTVNGTPISTACTGPDGTRLTATPADGFVLDHWDFCSGTNPCDPTGPDVTAYFRDNIAPTVTIGSAVAGFVHNTISLTAQAADNVAVRDVVYTIGTWTDGNEHSPYLVSYDTKSDPDGPATISAVATDVYGNPSTPASVDVTIDNTAPTLTVTGPSGGTYGAAATEAWTLAAGDATSGIASVRCSVVAQGQDPSFGACASATSHSASHLPSGAYTLAVRATDGAGNTTDATRSFAVDASPPETSITAGPAEGSTSVGSSASFAFASTETGSTFACRLYPAAAAAAPYAPCSPAYSVAGLAPGAYVLEVVATDTAGNTDPTPARRAFAMAAAPAPSPTPTPSPAPEPRRAPLTLSRRFAVHGDRTRITRLRAFRLASGSAIRITCRGRGCRFAHRTVHAHGGQAELARLFGSRPLRAGARVTLRITAPGLAARTVTLVIRRGRQPTLVG